MTGDDIIYTRETHALTIGWTRADRVRSERFVPAGTKKTSFLPYVRASLVFWEAMAVAAEFERDNVAQEYWTCGGITGVENAAKSAAVLRERFLALTGREYDPIADRITRQEIKDLDKTPVTVADPLPGRVCHECGAEYPAAQAHLVDSDGMGCARCNA